jgi:ubiquinone/menaquinone biosynthesis C-methylase UbiE
MIEVFEESAKEYDDWFIRHKLVYRSEMAAVRAFMPTAGQGLEIGVGTGRFAWPLGIKVGVAQARAMAEIARTRGIGVVRGCAEALPFANTTFDFILIVTVLCFLIDPFQALCEATRVLKPQGRLIIGIIDPDSPLGKAYEANKHENKFYLDARFYSVSQISNWLRTLGFEILSTCQTIFKNPSNITKLEPVRPGHGEGGFAVISAQKVVKCS